MEHEVRGTPTSTLSDVRTGRAPRRVRLGRRIVLGALAMVVALAATGALGVHTSSAQAMGEGWSMQVHYPRVARAGLDTEWRVTVRHPGGFGKDPIVLGVSTRYFDIFETQGFHPQPSAETSDGRLLYLSFDPPAGEVFSVDYDAYIQPSSQLGRRAQVALMDGERTRLRVQYRTWLLP